MWHQYPGLTEVLAEQRMTQRRQQADTGRLLRSTRPRRRRSQQAMRRWQLLVRWPVRA